MPDWLELQDDLAPVRAKVAGAKAAIDAAKEARDQLEPEVIAARVVLRNLEHKQMDYAEKIAAILATTLGIDSVELGFHGCEHSPTGKCFYDALNDYCSDSCITCGSPSERK